MLETMSLDSDFVLERVDRPSRAEIDRYVCEAKPFVITGTVTDWKAYSMWKNPQYLIEKIGADTKLPLRTRFAKYENAEEWLGEQAQISFEDFMNHWLLKKRWTLEQDDKESYYYLASLPMGKHFPQLCEDVVVPDHAAEQKKTGNLWIGNAGQITPVHYDHSTGDPGMDGLHAVVIGRKTFRLFDPAKNVGCFPRKKQWGRFHQSLVDVSNGLPNEDQFPQFKNAKFIEIDLKGGEMLFIPKLWWHHVVTEEPSVSVNFWFQHLGSEKLKLTRHWGHMVDYLSMVEQMEITKEKMRNVLQFYGMKVTDEQVEYYAKNPRQFMLLPPFLATFANGTRAPWIASPEGRQFERDIMEKVKDWVLTREGPPN
eukprot:TRINITY_DN4753_c0_g1_i1.p1 TRINITY_DN4753_c0_g1~~TRINITY_DN4753_c0_g1_i1.p1  ORF type:complete len:369 (-),score=90.59 TRINITY_DN4753_c0_g1_i1:240-1346(-)